MGGSWWVTDALEMGGPVYVYSWVVIVVGSIVLHELGHGWMAIRLGDRTPLETGHMTWNPVVHMGMYSLVVFALIGIAWGMMPVDPSRVRGRHGDALVALAGPAVNLVLMVLSIFGAVGVLALGDAGHIPPGREELAGHVFAFFMLGGMLNLGLAVFNLVPVPPLDGSRIASSFAPGYRRLFESEQGMVLGMAGFALLFFFGGDVIFGFAAEMTTAMIDTVAGWFGLGL